MDLAAIAALIGAGESLTVEFKSDRNSPLNDDEMVELVVCLTNSAGGSALIGVEDDGSLTGLGKRRAQESPETVAAMIFNRTEPPVAVEAKRLAVEDKEILAIVVPASPVIVATTGGKCVRRVIGTRGPECVPFPPIQHAGRMIDLGLLDYSSSSVPESTITTDVDPLAMARLRTLVRVGAPSLAEMGDAELLGALGLANWTGQSSRCLNVSGLLCVGNRTSIRRWAPTHQIAFQVMDELGQVVVNEFFDGSLLTVLDEIELRFAARNGQAEVLIGLLRVGVPDYPPASFREALLNAVVHRDYARLGAIHVQMHPDHLSISSPGGFPEGVTLSNLLVHDPVPRNPRLADVFLRVGLVERAGQGIDRIFLNQLRNGRPAPDYSASDASGVRLSLPGGAPSLAFVKFIVEQERSGPGVGLQELLVLNHVNNRIKLTISQAAKLLQVSNDVADRVLEALLERGWIVRDRSKGAFRLSPSIYTALGKPADYVRAEGFTQIQRVSMVEKYVDTYGRIVRSEVADLCQISSDEAKVLLRKLVREERLTLHESRRKAWYEPGPSIGSGPKALGKSQTLELALEQTS